MSKAAASPCVSYSSCTLLDASSDLDCFTITSKSSLSFLIPSLPLTTSKPSLAPCFIDLPKAPLSKDLL